jgi:hypothetical protein
MTRQFATLLLLSADFRLGLEVFAAITVLVFWIGGWVVFAVRGGVWRVFVGIVMMFAVPLAIVMALVGRP